MKKYKIIFCFIFLTFFTAKGQISTYSPYSHFGIGQLYNANSISNVSMGGLGLSIMDQHTLNYINPATYSFLTQTSFELGFRSSFLQMSQDDLEQKNFVSGLSNMGLGFPISNNIGFTIGLLPYSSVGYNVTSQVLNNEDIGLVDYTYSGSGGVNKILIGAGWHALDINKINVSVGANFNYFFGSIDKTVNISTENAPIQFREQKSNIINDFNFDFGILAKYSINNYNVNFGTSITPKKSIQSTTNLFQHTHITSGNYESFLDTILYVNGENDHINMPLSYSMGLSIESDLKWLIGLDYHYTNWEDYNIAGGYMRDKNEIIFGGKFTPKQEDIHNYFNRVEYKFGFSYGIGYLDLGEAINAMEQESILKDLSISAGMALPLNRVSSKVNIGFRYGNRGGYLDNNFIQERYWAIYLSMTLNEKWFKKRKIE